MAELAHAYVSIRASTGGMQGDVRKALTGIESQAGKTGQNMGQKLSSGIGSVLKKTAVGVGVAGGAALAAGLTKGIGRLNSIEQAEAKLSGLGNSAADVGGIMENALTSVRGTSYGLEEAATIAASAVAAGIKPGQDLERTLKLTGDAAAIAGTDLAQMGSIVNKVATSDMMQMDVANQLMDAGIPILQMVASEMGVTAEEARKMASEGKISFETFQNALEQGVGGAALKMGDTTQGAFKNMGAAAGRLGATLAGPFFDQAGGAFRGITDLLDDLNAAAGPAMEEVAAWLERAGGAAADAFAQFRESEFARTAMSDLGNIFASLAGTAAEVWPSLQKIAGALAEASAALGVSAWDAFVVALRAASGVLDALVGPLGVVADVMEDQPGLVTAAVAAWLAFKTVPAIMGKVSGAIDGVTDKIDPVRSGIAGFGQDMAEQRRYAEFFGESLGTAGSALGALEARMPTLGKAATAYRNVSGRASESAGFHMAMAQSVDSAGGAFHLAAAGASKFGGVVGGGLAAGLSAASSGVGKVVNALGGPLNVALAGATIAVSAGIAANQKLESSQEALEDASHDLAVAQTDMWSQIGDASGVADAVVDQIQSIKAEMDAAISGEQRGFGADVLETWNNLSNIDSFGDLWSGGDVGTEMRAEANELADAAKLASAALDELGMSNDDVAAAISGSAGDWDEFRIGLLATGDSGAAAVAKLQPLRDEFEALESAQRIATPGTLELSAAVDVLADSASSADDKLGAMEDALKALGIMSSDAETSAFELAAAVEEVAQKALEGAPAAGGLGKELLTLEGGLDGSKANAQDLAGELEGLGAKFLQHAQDTGDAAGAYDKVRPALQSLADTYDLPIEKIEELAAQWGGIDADAVQLLVGVDGADESRQKIAEVALAMDQIADGEPKTVVMRVEDEAARSALSDLGLDVEAIEGKPGMVRITADSTVAVTAMNMVAERLGGLDSSVATPDINADDTVFQLTDEKVQADLRNLDLTQVDPAVGAIIDDFINGRDVTLAELARIDGTTAEPHIAAEISEALEKAKIVNDNLDRAARHRTAIITLEQRGSLGARAYDSSGTAVGQQYAAGGRLPTSGPGTSTTDGILGIGSDGSPTAWVDRGEWIVNRNASDDYNNVLSMINRDDPRVRHLKGYAGGGRAGDEFLDFVHGRSDHGQSRPLDGAPYVWGGVNWGDCSGAMAAIARFAVGLAPFAGRFATGNQREALLGMGFKLGRGGDGDLRFGWYNGGPAGGHTSGTLPDGTHVEMGGTAGGGKIGGAATGANWSRYTDHAYLPVGPGWNWSDVAYTGRRGRGLVRGDGSIDPFTGQTSFTSNGRNGGATGDSRPTTWSGIAGQFADDFASGHTQDMLGVFGIPDQLPPILQAWNMLNETPSYGGPTDWDLSVAAANVKKFDAQVRMQSAVVAAAEDTLSTLSGSDQGDPHLGAFGAAHTELDRFRNDLLGTEMNRKAAEAHLADLVGTREALLMASEAKSENASASAEELAETAKGEAKELEKAAHKYDPAKGAEQWRPLVNKLLAEKGQPLEYADAVIARINQESSGNPRSQNNSDSNAAAGTPSKGLMQPIDPTFQAFKDHGFDDIWDPEANIRASMNYVLRDPKFKGRSMRDVYMQAGGYNLGGWISGFGSKDSVPLVGAPGEFIVNRKAAAQNRDMLEAMNSGQPVAPAGGGVTYNIYAFDLDEAMVRTSRREAQHAQTYMGAR